MKYSTLDINGTFLDRFEIPPAKKINGVSTELCWNNLLDLSISKWQVLCAVVTLQITSPVVKTG
jgi:hypothetical protein